jgi:hypothetical protein
MNPNRNIPGSGKLSLADLQAAGVGSVIEVPVSCSYHEFIPGEALVVGFVQRGSSSFARVRLKYRGPYHKCPPDGYSTKVSSVHVEQVIRVILPATAAVKQQEAPA